MDTDKNPGSAFPAFPASDRLTSILYFGTHGAILLTLVLLLIEIVSPKRIPVADVGTPLGLMLLFFLIPAGWVAIRLRTRKLDSDEKKVLIPHFKTVQILWLVTWLFSCLPIIFYGSFYLHYAPRPWLSANQGPDTEDSLSAFSRTFGFDTGQEVLQVYHRGSPDLQLFRFNYSETGVVDRIVSQLNLQPVPQCYLNIVSPPDWWAQRKREGRCFADAAKGHRSYQLLVHTDEKQVYYMEFHT